MSTAQEQVAQLKSWAMAARAAYRNCIKRGVGRKNARAGILAGLRRQDWHKGGFYRAKVPA